MVTNYESSGKRKKKEEEPTFGDRLKDAVNKLKSEYHKNSGVPREEDMPWSDKNWNKRKNKTL